MPWLRGMLAAFAIALATGCTAPRPGLPVSARPASLIKMDPVRIQADTMGFADRFVTGMTGVYDEIERNASTPGVRDAAHQLKTDLALGAISHAVNPRPIAGMINLVVLVTLLRQIAEDPWTAQTFGPDAARLVAALRRQEADVRAVARSYLSDAQLAELDQLAQRWHRAHPHDRAVSHVQLADLPEANRAPAEPGKPPSGVFELLLFDLNTSLEPAVREIELSRATSERIFFYLQRMPLLLQLQAEGFYRRLLDTPEFKRALSDVSAATASANDFVQTSNRFTTIAAHLPEQLTTERLQAIQQAGAEVARQRDAAIRQLTAAVAVQREAALSQATTSFATQRQETIAALQREEQAFVAHLEAAIDRTVDRLLTRLAALGLCLVILVVLAAYGYRNVARRWPGGGPPRA